MNSNKKIAKNKKSSSSAKEKKDVKLPVNMDLGIHFLEFLMAIKNTHFYTFLFKSGV